MMLLALAAGSQLSAQYHVRILIARLPPNTTTEQIYIAGNFNGWNPADENFKFAKNGIGNFSFTMQNIPAGDYEFKFTKGSWQTVETTREKKNISNP